MWHGDASFLALPADLAAFAWSAPMRELAATIGISDVGLKKLLKAQGIVTPPQGHWNRVRAGQVVPTSPPPAPRGPGASGRVRLDRRFFGHLPEAQPMAENGPFASLLVPEDLAELRTRELGAIGRAPAPRDLARPPAGLARVLRREADRRAKAAASQWSWDEPHFDTPLAQRQLRILAGLFNALARRGHTGEAAEDNHGLCAHCTIGEQGLELRFEIVGQNATEMRGGYQRPARSLPASTALRLVMGRTLRAKLPAAWADSPGSPLEKQLATIAADLVVAGEAAFRQGLVEARERDEAHRKWEEERRVERLKALEKKRVIDLENSGELLRQADQLRALVARVGEAMVRGERAGITPDQLARWKKWALARADELDPVQSGQVLSHLYIPDLDDRDLEG